MNKYYYFCVDRFEDAMDARLGRTKRVCVRYFSKSVYASATLAALANVAWMATHLGERFSIVGFEHQLELDEHGRSLGKYKAADDDSIVINKDLRGAIALMKANAKQLKVEL